MTVPSQLSEMKTENQTDERHRLIATVISLYGIDRTTTCDRSDNRLQQSLSEKSASRRIGRLFVLVVSAPVGGQQQESGQDCQQSDQKRGSEAASFDQ